MEKAGQMIMIGLEGEELTAEEQSLLRDYPFGGFVLFSRNLKEPGQISDLCRSLWKRSELPPFIAIDQEGGRVHRLPAPFTRFPSAQTLGRKGSPALAYRVGQAAAREISAVGINLNFAPVLDVASNPENPVIGDRALSADPAQVISLGWALVEGLRSGGVIPCGKHFPGHGDTAKDSHVELPIVDKEEALLRALELRPFAHACRNGIEALMTAHVLYPAFDRKYPATLSPGIVGDLLRGELHFDGVLFSDDLEMGAISRNFEPEEAVFRSVDAGVDVLLFSRRKDLPVGAFELLVREAGRSAKLRERMEKSSKRIEDLKAHYLRSCAETPEDELLGLIRAHRRILEEFQGSL